MIYILIVLLLHLSYTGVQGIKYAFFTLFLRGGGRYCGGEGCRGFCVKQSSVERTSTHCKVYKLLYSGLIIRKMELIMLDIVSIKLGDAFKMTLIVNLIQWFQSIYGISYF